MIILPRNREDPTGQNKRLAGAEAQIKARLREIRKQVMPLVETMPRRKVTLWSPLVTNAEAARYEYLVDSQYLANMFNEMDAVVDQQLTGPNWRSDTWVNVDYVIPAYQQGTALAVASLSTRTMRYYETRRELADVVLSEPYRARVALVRGRVFERMKALSAETKADLRMVLAESIQMGLGPADIAARLTQQLGIEATRALRIARTEINNALRTARLDEAEATAKALGMRVMMLHISALSPTTRVTHWARHGRLYTIEECREWWATSPNSINCKCSVTEVFVDEDGNPLDPTVVERAQEKLKSYKPAADQQA